MSPKIIGTPRDGIAKIEPMRLLRAILFLVYRFFCKFVSWINSISEF